MKSKILLAFFLLVASWAGAQPREGVDAAVAEAQAYIQQQEDAGAIDRSSPIWRTQLPAFKPLTFTEGKMYYWNLRTNKGEIKIRLMPDIAPNHVSSTIYLTELGFYNDLSFHRVIPGFMAQGGCPLGRGTGGPGYTYSSEISARVRHDRAGLLSMANTGRPKSDGSQFFLTFGPAGHLDGKHTIFGEVVEGMEVLEELENCGSRPRGVPTEALDLERATISVE